MSYVGAPYNFVPLGTRVYRKDNITRHDEITGLSGYLEYQVTAQTPILVDRGDNHFYKNKDGKAAIPGSTMRGLVRSNMQILSQSSVVDDIANAKLMYRCVGGGKRNINKKPYGDTLGSAEVMIGENKFSVLKNVKGGYICCKNGKYYIIPSSVQKLQEKLEEMNYYILSERRIIESHFDGFEMLRKDPCILQNANTEPFKKIVKEDGIHYKGEKNYKYRPYFKTVYYLPKGERNIAKLSETQKDGYKKGTLITTGFMNEKKAFYVIPERADIAESEWTEIPPQDVDSFKRDFEGRKNQLSAAAGFKVAGMPKEDKDRLKKELSRFFGLPENGEIKPVFYIELDGKLYFGFTPRLRLFYEKEIYDGLPKEQKDNRVDYCKSLFGFASDIESYRSRLSFQDAVIDKNAAEKEKRTMVLGEPKPTSYLDYLVGKGGAPAAYRGDFSLRGMKQYWLHTEERKGEAGRNKEVGSDLYPYPQGTSFTGRIRFTNLQREELGMLLWSLLLEKNSQQNIGKGKPYGYGRISVSLKHLNIQDPEKLYGGDTLCLEPYQERKENCETYIAEAKADMTRFLGKEVMKYPPIRDFLLMKNVQEIPPESKTHYMSIEGKDSDYQARMRNQIMLDTIGEVLGKEKKKALFSKPQDGYRDRNGKGESQRQEGGYRGNNDNDKKSGQMRENRKQDRDRRGERNQSKGEEKERTVYSSGGSIHTPFADILQGYKDN